MNIEIPDDDGSEDEGDNDAIAWSNISQASANFRLNFPAAGMVDNDNF